MLYESKLTAEEVAQVLDLLTQHKINPLWRDRVLNGIVEDVTSGFYTIEDAVIKFIDECIPDSYKIDTEREKEIIRAKAKAEAEEKKEKVNQWVKENSPTAKGSGDPNAVWHVPITSHFDHLKNKDINMCTLGGLTLISKYGGKAHNMNERYIYKNDLDFNELAVASNVSESTAKRHFNKLKKIAIEGNKPLISTENTSNGIVYKINYATAKLDEYGDPSKNRYYTTIESDLLKYLIDNTNDNVIKLYVFFKVHLIQDDQYITKEMQREYLASGIGFKTTKIMCDKISTMTSGLVAHGLLFKEEKLEFVYDETKGREVPKTKVRYKLASYDQWLNYQKELDQKGIQ